MSAPGLAAVIERAANDWRAESDRAQWSGGCIKPPLPRGQFIAAAVAAHMQSDAVMHITVRASCKAEGVNDDCDFPACGCIGRGVATDAAIRAALGVADGNDQG